MVFLVEYTMQIAVQMEGSVLQSVYAGVVSLNWSFHYFSGALQNIERFPLL